MLLSFSMPSAESGRSRADGLGHRSLVMNASAPFARPGGAADSASGQLLIAATSLVRVTSSSSQRAVRDRPPATGLTRNRSMSPSC